MKQSKFYLSPQKHDNGEHPIKVSVSVHGIRLLTTIGESVAQEFWNNDTKTVSFPRGVTNSHGKTDKQLNALMLQIGAGFALYESTLEKAYKPTVEELRDKLATITGTTRKKVSSKREKADAIIKAQEEERARQEAEAKSRTVGDYFREFIEEEKDAKEWADGTTITMRGFGKKLAGFNSLDYLNSEDGIKEFIGNLKGEELANRTIEKKFRLLRWFLVWCERKGYIVCSNEKVYQNGF